MDFRDSLEEASFRAEVREFVQRELPADIDERQEWGTFALGDLDELIGMQRPWEKKLAARGWLAPAWPKEYGG